MVSSVNNPSRNLISRYQYNNGNTIVTLPEQKSVKYTGSPATVTPDYNVIVPQTYTKLSVEKLTNGQEIHCYKLANGQRVMIAPIDAPQTYINTYVNTGSFNEKDEERGISHFLEHMAFNGTNGNNGYTKLVTGDVFKKAAEMGGYTNACTSNAETNYTVGIPQYNKSDLENTIAMQAAMMNNLELSDEMIEKEKGPVSSEINMYSDFMYTKAANIALNNLYNVQSTSEDTVAGRVDNIQNLNRKKVMDYYKKNYFPSNMVTVITGDVNPDEAIALVAKHFRGENPPQQDRKFEKLTPTDKQIRQDVFSPKAKKTFSTVAFNGPANNDIKSQLAMSVALNILASKANSRIKTPLTDINTDLNIRYEKISSVPTDGQIIALDTETTEENNEKSLNIIFNEINNFKIKDEDELQQVKDSLKSHNQDIYDSTDKLNYMIGSNSLNINIKDIAEQDKIIDSLTIQDVENAVKKYMNTNKVSVAVVHPDNIDKNTLVNNYNKIHNKTSISFKGRMTEPNSEPLNRNNLSSYTLNNNYNIAFYDTPHNTNARSMITYTPLVPVKTKPGTEQILAKMLDDRSQTKNNSQFRDYLDKNNITQNLHIDKDGTLSIYGQMPSKSLQQFINISQEQLMLPNFDVETFEKQKAILKENCLHAEPDSEENLNRVMYGNENVGYTNQDILNNIDNIQLQDVINLYNNIMQTSQASVCVATSMADRQALNTTLSSFSRMPMVQMKNNTPYNLYNKKDKSIVTTDIAPHAQADIIQAYNFVDNGNVRDDVSFTLMNIILSNGEQTGLFNNLREKEKLAYAVRSSYKKDGNNGIISCQILTTTDNKEIGEQSYDNVQKSINGFHRQINKMKSGEFTDEELISAKKILKNELKGMCYSQKSVYALDRAINSPYGVDEINEKYNMIDKLSKQDIINAANYVFNNKPVYSIVASKDTLDANKEYFEKLKNN